MIPIKLVEMICQRLWALVLPAILVPLLVVGLTQKTEQFQSNAVVWVSSPVAGESQALGYNNTYLTPAQNQAQAFNDLLATQTFRSDVVRSAGILGPGSSDSAIRDTAAGLKIWAAASGANLVTVSSVSGSAKDAKAVTASAIEQFSNRAATQFQKDSSVSAAYYQQQLASASQELSARQAAVSQYLVSHPRAANPANPESLDIDYRTLVEHVTSQQTLVSQLQTSLQEVQLRQASAPQTQEAAFSVQDSASEPAAALPVGATRRFGLPFAGLLFGLLIGATYIYLSYRADHTIRSASDLEPMSVRLLGSVPDLHAAPPWLRLTPVGWVMDWRQRDFARKTAASIGDAAAKARRSQEA
jgi:capsular polysaccharide biosynthesis protein